MNNLKSRTMRVFNIRYIIIALFAFGFSLSTIAQQLPLYSSYVYNPMLMSPSFAGVMDQQGQVARLMLAHRYQYAGFEGAPTTSLLALDAPFSSQKMGLGGMLYTDLTGLIRQTGFGLNYSYKVNLYDKAIWHLGLAANAGQQSLEMSAVNAVDMTENILNLESANKVYVNGTFGTHLEAGNLNVGFAVQQLTQNQLVFQNYVSNVNFTYEQPAHYYGFASYRFDVKGDTFGITPILAARYVAGTAVQYDLIVKAHVHNKVFITAGYRGGYALSFGAGAVLNNNLTLSYTYDHMINDAGPFTGGGNEFTLGYRFFKGKGLPTTPNEPATIINQGLTQEEVDAIFEEKVRTMRDRMDQLTQENAEHKAEIDRLNNKIDSLHMTPSEMEVAAAEVTVKNGFVANNIQFPPNTARLTETSQQELDKIVAYLLINKDINIVISGHTDNTGNDDANLMLSKMRARAVYDYMAARGVDATRMEHNGFGASKPIADNATQQGRDQNRRVELKIK